MYRVAYHIPAIAAFAIGYGYMAAASSRSTAIDVTALPGTPAKADAVWGVTDCAISEGSENISCTKSPISDYGTGTVVVVDDAGSGRGPLIGTITQAGGVFLNVPAAFAVPVEHATGFAVVTPGIGYTLDSVQTIPCVGCVAEGGNQVSATPAVLTAVAASVATGGTGGTNGTCTVIATDQTALAGHPTSVVVVVKGGSIDHVMSVPPGGLATSITGTHDNTGAYKEPVSGCGSLSGASLNVQYGVQTERVTPGLYNPDTLPTGCPGTATVTSMVGSMTIGSNLTVKCDTYLSTTSFGTDNTSAFQNAVSAMNSASAMGTQLCLTFPAGNYLTGPLNTAGANGGNTMAQGYGCFLGDEHYHSNIFLVPNTAGDLFAWNDAGNNNASPPFGNTQTFASNTHPNRAGSAVRHLTIIGDRASTANQNALAFYGPTSSLRVDDVRITFIRGHALIAGLPDASNTGNLTDARLTNLALEHDGDFTPTNQGAALATLDIGAVGGPGSSGIDLLNLRFFRDFGPSLWLHTTADAQHPATSNTAHVNILTLKAEEGGLESVTPTGTVADMVLLGDAHAAGANVSDILGRNIELVNQVPAGPFLHIAGPAAARIDLEFLMEATNSTGLAPGLAVDACQQCSFHAIKNQANDTRLQIGTPP